MTSLKTIASWKNTGECCDEVRYAVHQSLLRGKEGNKQKFPPSSPNFRIWATPLPLPTHNNNTRRIYSSSCLRLISPTSPLSIIQYIVQTQTVNRTQGCGGGASLRRVDVNHP